MTDQKTEDEWHKIIDDCKKSKLTVKAFCQAKNIKLSTYYKWHGKLKVNRKRIKKTTFTEVKIDNAKKEVQQNVVPPIVLKYKEITLEIDEMTNQVLLAEGLKTLQSI